MYSPTSLNENSWRHICGPNQVLQIEINEILKILKKIMSNYVLIEIMENISPDKR